MARPTVLIVDDSVELAKSLAIVMDIGGFAASTAGSVAEGRRRLDACRFDAIILDLRLPDGNGLDLLPDARRKCPAAWIVIFSGLVDVGTTVRAMRTGADDVIEKGCDPKMLLARVRDHMAMPIRDDGDAVRSAGEGPVLRILGECPEILDALLQIDDAAASDSSVLIVGETGTGKEIAARRIHALSRRSRGRLVVVNCGAIPSELVVSELFGHRKGAFTTAIQDRKGAFERAHGGTLFLDEISQLEIADQSALNRAVEGQGFIPLGGNSEARPDVRIIAATNGTGGGPDECFGLRPDVFHRMDRNRIVLPPLRDRGGDIRILAAHFLVVLGGEIGKPGARLSVEAERAIVGYGWPGNVRELRNVIEKALRRCRGPEVRIEDLPDQVGANPRSPDGCPPSRNFCRLEA